MDVEEAEADVGRVCVGSTDVGMVAGVVENAIGKAFD